MKDRKGEVADPDVFRPMDFPKSGPLTESQKTTAKRLLGKRIKRVRLNPFTTGRFDGDEPATDPEIEFEDGSILRFVTEETEIGEYGVALVYPGKTKRR